MTRTIAIGDIHGCITAFETLLDAIEIDALDTIVTLGDYIDRGPDSRAVVERLLDLQQQVNLVSLIGNHEAMLLDSFRDEATRMAWLSYGGRETMYSYGIPPNRLPEFPEDHLEFFRRCRLFFETSMHIFVHGGCVPFLPLDQTAVDDLIWKKLGENPVRPHVSGKMVVCGHTPQISGDILDLGFLKCIDTACYAGGWLTALEVTPPFQLWQANEQGMVRRAMPMPVD